MKGRGRLALGLLGLLVAALFGFAVHIGYFGGPVFTDVPATSPAAPGRGGVAAVILSGDMGFKVGMGPRIARRLAADGIPVVGVNSLAYFRHERTPDEVAALVASAARRALAFGHARRLVLIGQSFGADMLHVGLTRLSPDLRARVRLVALVVPTDTLFFRASPSELFNWAKPDALALPTARALTWVPVVCIHGEDETESLCPLLGQPNVRSVALPGGHPLDGDVDAVHRVLAATIDRVFPRYANITKISGIPHAAIIAQPLISTQPKR
ncbi:virulence factor [Sphingomonas colocasiae]|uniref:Virulence factor n=1 Tax=Sphingomonas colocasiae TaxID=1848973 RepID=A0ABS7PMS4_9SPHN|nr:virulence factor [Sphingomonas colocasiae]MBY8822607.1 virulence factor [Sphingomonas colocasiae]